MPLLTELEKSVWKFEESGELAGWDRNSLRATSKLFFANLLELQWNRYSEKVVSENTKLKAAKSLASDMRRLIRKATGIDSRNLYSFSKNESPIIK